MKRMNIFVIGAGMSICAMAASGSLAAKPIKVSELGEGQRLEVAFSSSGCFNSRSLAFVFERGKGLEAEVFEVVRQDGNPSGRRVRLGKTVLTPDESRRLDNLFRFFRGVKEGHCTSSETVKLNLFEGAKRVGQEEYTDSTCTNRGDDVLNLASLADRFAVRTRN